jgi:hypothetical protein
MIKWWPAAAGVALLVATLLSLASPALAADNSQARVARGDTTTTRVDRKSTGPDVSAALWAAGGALMAAGVLVGTHRRQAKINL